MASLHELREGPRWTWRGPYLGARWGTNLKRSDLGQESGWTGAEEGGKGKKVDFYSFKYI